jgi:hypothetical protein
MMEATRPLTEITQEALRLLYRELGLVNTIRFLNQFTTGFGNYTEERRALMEHETLETVLTEVYSYQAQKAIGGS